LALAGVRPKDISRGYVVVTPASLKEASLLEVKMQVEKRFESGISAGGIVHVNLGLQVVTGKIYPYMDLRGVKVLKKTVEPGSSTEALMKLDKPVPVEIGDKALLMKLDLPPKQFRIVGLAEVINIPVAFPEMRSAKVKQGFVGEKTPENLFVVSGLFQTIAASQHVIGHNVLTASRTKGTIVSSFGDQGDVLVNFEKPPSVSEKVYYYKLRIAKIA
jgi:selenocysteine-specific elongation factor